MEAVINLIPERPRLLKDFISKINAEQAGFLLAAKTAGNSLLAGANHRREIGVLLATLKEATDSEGAKLVPHGKWESMFAGDRTGKCNSGVAFEFSSETARRYIAFAARHPEPITSLSEIVRDGGQMLIDAGELDAPSREPNSQQTHADQDRWLTAILNAKEQIAALTEKAPVTEWPTSRRQQMKENLRPLAELYATL